MRGRSPRSSRAARALGQEFIALSDVFLDSPKVYQTLLESDVQDRGQETVRHPFRRLARSGPQRRTQVRAGGIPRPAAGSQVLSFEISDCTERGIPPSERVRLVLQGERGEAERSSCLVTPGGRVRGLGSI